MDRRWRQPEGGLGSDWTLLGSFTLDRYGHLHPEADTALRDRLDALYGTSQPEPMNQVVRLPRRPGRGPQRGPGASGNDKSAADGARTML